MTRFLSFSLLAAAAGSCHHLDRLQLTTAIDGFLLFDCCTTAAYMSLVPLAAAWTERHFYLGWSCHFAAISQIICFIVSQRSLARNGYSAQCKVQRMRWRLYAKGGKCGATGASSEECVLYGANVGFLAGCMRAATKLTKVSKIRSCIHG